MPTPIINISCALSLVAICNYKRILDKVNILLWKKKLNIKQKLALFNKVFAHIDGFIISKLARKQQDAPEYLYGEIEFVSFTALLSLTNPNTESIFYDLGSGIGKAVIACALNFPVKMACGIEILAPMHSAALTAERILALECKSPPNIKFLNTDFLTHPLTDASIIFINATAFIGELWDKLNNKLDQELQENCYVLSTTKHLKFKRAKFIKHTNVLMSWGIASVNIYVIGRK
jgi:Histone methylation protein DOT1